MTTNIEKMRADIKWDTREFVLELIPPLVGRL
jgi:hypothetical protein